VVKSPWVTQREGSKYAAKQRPDFTLADRTYLDAALRADPRQVVCDTCTKAAGSLRLHRSPKG
jgi:hypothetical protein